MLDAKADPSYNIVNDDESIGEHPRCLVFFNTPLYEGIEFDQGTTLFKLMRPNVTNTKGQKVKAKFYPFRNRVLDNAPENGEN